MSGTLRLATTGFRRGQRGPTVMLFVVVWLASVGIAAATSVAIASGSRVDAAFVAANGPDVVVTTAVGGAHDVAHALHGDPRVAGVGRPVLARSAEMRLDGERSIEHLVAVADLGQIGKPVTRTGRMPRAAREIALDAGVALQRGITPGDEIDLDGVTFEVVGTAFDFSDCFYPTCDPARSWITDDGLARLGGATLAVTHARLVDPADGAAVEQRLASELDTDRLSINTWLDTRGDLLTETTFFSAFLGVFGIFVLVASTVVIAAALAARTIARRRKIGLYKALGGTPGQITMAIVGEHLMVAALAVAGGWLAAGLLSPQLEVGALRVVGAGQPMFEWAGLIVAGMAAMSMVTLATLIPAWRAGRIPVVDALGDSPRLRRRPSRLLGRLTSRSSVPVDVGARSWVARPGRTMAAVIALALAVVGGTVAMSIDHTMDHLLAHPQLTGDPWDVAFTPDEAEVGVGVESRLDRLAEVGSWYSIINTRVTIGGERVHARLLGGDPAAAGYRIGSGRGVTGPDEAVVGYGLLDDFGWRVGDTIPVEIGGSTRQVLIVGWYGDTEDGGHILQMRQEGLADSDAIPTYAVSARPGVSATQLAVALRALDGDIEVNEWDGSSLQPFRAAMLIMSLLLGGVALAHLFATALATARLRANDNSMLRAIGVTRRQLTRATMVAATFTGMVALVVGLPLGWLAQRGINDVITSAVGVGPGASPSPPVGAVILLATAAIVLAAAVECAATASGRRGPVPRTR